MQISIHAEQVTLLHGQTLNTSYFADTLLIATTSKTTTSAPITVQIHIPPPIHPYAWFITETLSFGSAVLYFYNFVRRSRLSAKPQFIFGSSCSNHGRF